MIIQEVTNYLKKQNKKNPLQLLGFHTGVKVGTGENRTIL